MRRAADEGHRVVLIVATNGEFGDAPDDLADGETLADRRASETDASAAALGIARVVRLGYRDSGMTGWDGNADPDSFHQADVDTAAPTRRRRARRGACRRVHPLRLARHVRASRSRQGARGRHASRRTRRASDADDAGHVEPGRDGRDDLGSEGIGQEIGPDDDGDTTSTPARRPTTATRSANPRTCSPCASTSRTEQQPSGVRCAVTAARSPTRRSSSRCPTKPSRRPSAASGSSRPTGRRRTGWAGSSIDAVTAWSSRSHQDRRVSTSAQVVSCMMMR